MLGPTHSLVGAVLGLQLASALHLDLPHAGALALIGAVGALAPDLDTAASTLSRSTRYVSWPIRLLTRHRGLTHSLLALVVIGVLTVHFYPVYGVAFTGGYGSHIIADMSTKQGVLLLWPFDRALHLLPKPLRLKTGGIVEKLIFLSLTMLMISLLNVLAFPNGKPHF